jgi:hypothetical protein
VREEILTWDPKEESEVDQVIEKLSELSYRGGQIVSGSLPEGRLVLHWKEEDERVYLGDSVYVGLDRGMIKLTTDYGSGPSNTIYLEPDVYESLVRWVAYIRKKAADRTEHSHELQSDDGSRGETPGAAGEAPEESCVRAEAPATEGDPGKEERGRV